MSTAPNMAKMRVIKKMIAIVQKSVQQPGFTKEGHMLNHTNGSQDSGSSTEHEGAIPECSPDNR